MKKHRMTTKALSVLLTVIMLFTTISVGLIVPDADLTASAATVTVKSWDELRTQITAANSASEKTVIKLGQTISYTGGTVSALPTITGDVVLDLNGNHILVTYELSGGYSSDQTGCQIPSENITTHSSTELLPSSLINVGSEGALQIVNTGLDNNCSIQLIAKVYDSNKNNSCTHYASAGAVSSAGTLIIGDPANTAHSTVTIYTHAEVAHHSSTGGDKKHGVAKAMAVTVNGADAVFKMYGGIIKATGFVRSRKGNATLRAYALNIQSAYSAEIYGGTISIPSYSGENGLRNPCDNALESVNAQMAAIRCNTNNLFIFNVTSEVEVFTGGDTSSKAQLTASNVYSTTNNAATVYGGDFSYHGKSNDSDQSTAPIYAYTFHGDYNIAIDGSLSKKYGSNKDSGSTSDGLNDFLNGSNKECSGSFQTQTIFIHDGGSAFNGVDIFSYPTFRDYKEAVENADETFDAYGVSVSGSPTASHHDTLSYTCTSTNYKRNAYTQTGWVGKTLPGTEAIHKNTSDAGVAANGGSLFLEPTWTPTLYNITYDFADNTAYPVTNKDVFTADGSRYKTYRIDTTDEIIAPVRPGWRFDGWIVDATVREATDDSFSWVDGGKQGGWNTVTNTAINMSVNGQYGDIHLTATWQPVTYTIGIDTDADIYNTVDKNSSYANGTINSAQTIPNWLEKDYYTFDGYYLVKEFDADSNWNFNEKIIVATSSASADRYSAAQISAQFAGRYGNITKLVAQFTPVEYTITFDIDDDENRVDTPSSNPDDYSYNVETVRALPLLTPLGQRFNGWRVVSSDGNWVVGRTYPSIPAGMHGNVKFIADYSDKEYEIEIVLGENEFFDISALGYGYTFKEGGEISGVAVKNGWDFDGWEIISSWSEFEDDIPDWGVGDIYYYDADTGLTNFDGGKVGNVRVKPHFVKHEYEITFNANSGAAVSTEKYKIDETKVIPSTTRNGWTFGGWRVTETVGSWKKGDIFQAGSTVLTGMWGSVTLEAVWTEAPYTVTLDLNGGDGVSNKVLSYITTASTYLREIPVKTGYTFKGWELTVFAGNWDEYKAKLAASGALVTDALPAGYYGNVTLKAVWEVTSYSMQFVRYPEFNKPYTYEHTIVLPEASAPGQSFEGWQLSDNAGNWTSALYKAGSTFTNKYGNVTFTPLFNAKTYTINFVDSDGVTAIGSSVYYKFTDSFKLSAHSKPGYTFTGWEVSAIANAADCGGWTVGDRFTAGDMDAGRFYGNITLKAVYEINEYNITFITDGGEPIADILYTTEATDVLPKPVKTGYDFAGWKVAAAGGNWTLNSTVVDGTALKGKYGDVTLTAQWSAHNYIITWNVDGKTTTTQVAYGEIPSFGGIPSKAQDQQYTYEFIGWTPAIEPVTGDVTYTAQFKSNLRVYSVTWKYLTSDAAGTTETVVTETYKYGEHPVFAGGNPSMESVNEDILYRFAGWTDADGKQLSDSTVVTGNAVYTASFTEVNKNTAAKITWNVDGVLYETYWVANNNEMPTYPGTNKLADSDGYSREIIGWTPKVEVVTGPMTYSAIINNIIKNYQASFDLKGGKYSGQTLVTYNRDVMVLNMPQPEKAGYTFMGWKVTKTESTMWTLNETYTEASYKGHWGEVSFEAVWKATEYTLTVKNDGTETKTAYTIESNSIIAPLSKEGYDLTGWLVLTADKDSNWMMGDTVATDKSLLGMYGNVTIEPVWSAKTYNLNWVSGDVTQTVEVRYGEYIVTYAPVTKAGYTAKWKEEIPATMPAHDVTINAEYTPIQYFLRFNSNGGSEVESFYYDITSDKLLDIPTREGATFKGWKVSAGGGSWIKDSVYDGGMALEGTYGNATLTAVWELEVFTITWIAGDVTRTTKWYHGAQPAYDGTPYKSSDFNNSYEFTGKWLTVNGEEITEIPVVTGNATYEAVFRAVERTYTVKWDVDGRIYEQTYTYGQSVECPFSASNPPVRPSTNEYEFTFLGWSPEITIVTGDVTYTAIFDVYTKIQGLRVDRTAIFLDINDSANVTAIISPSTATSKDVEWVSLNQNIATVNENGKIVGVSAGETLVRVQSKDGKFKAFCLVSVAPVTTDYIVVSAAGVSTTRLPGEAIQLYATVMPENASNKIVKWKTSDPSVATVDANGLVVFGSTTGTAVITATSDGYATGSITVTCTTNDSLIKDDVKTYVVMFSQSSSTYIIAGQTYESINIICKEGDTIEFLLTEPHFVTLNATQFERDTDGVYRIKNIKENYTVIASERPDLGFEPEPEEPEDNGTVKLSFFDKLKNFFRSIVEFFRGLFGG